MEPLIDILARAARDQDRISRGETRTWYELFEAEREQYRSLVRTIFKEVSKVCGPDVKVSEVSL